MRVIVWSKFDLVNASWRYEKTLARPEWWMRRAGLMAKYMLPSLQQQTFQDFKLWVPLLAQDMKRAAPVLRLVNEFGGHWTTNPLRDLCAIEDDVLQVWLDSDDLYREDALEKFVAVKLCEGLAICCQNGYCLDLVEDVLYSYHAQYPPFYALWYPRDALRSPETLLKYSERWKFLSSARKYVVHHQLGRCPVQKLLEDGLYCTTLNGTNVSKAHGNPDLHKHLGVKIEDKTLLRRFGL